MAAARDKDGGDDDIYADIVDYSHEEVERLLTTCRRLHADNARLVGETAELRTQLAAQQKSRDLLRRSFSSLMLTARAEIARKDARLAELQGRLDSRQLRCSGRELSRLVEREARRLASRRGRVSPPATPGTGPAPAAQQPRRRRSDVVASLEENAVTVQAANLSFSLATDQVPWSRHRTVQLGVRRRRPCSAEDRTPPRSVHRRAMAEASDHRAAIPSVAAEPALVTGIDCERDRPPDATSERVLRPGAACERVLTPEATNEDSLTPETAGESVLTPEHERALTPEAADENVLTPKATDERILTAEDKRVFTLKAADDRVSAQDEADERVLTPDVASERILTSNLVGGRASSPMVADRDSSVPKAVSCPLPEAVDGHVSSPNMSASHRSPTRVPADQCVSTAEVAQHHACDVTSVDAPSERQEATSAAAAVRRGPAACRDPPAGAHRAAKIKRRRAKRISGSSAATAASLPAVANPSRLPVKRKRKSDSGGSSAARRRRQRKILPCEDSEAELVIDVQFCVASADPAGRAPAPASAKSAATCTASAIVSVPAPSPIPTPDSAAPLLSDPVLTPASTPPPALASIQGASATMPVPTPAKAPTLTSNSLTTPAPAHEMVLSPSSPPTTNLSQAPASAPAPTPAVVPAPATGVVPARAPEAPDISATAGQQEAARQSDTAGLTISASEETTSALASPGSPFVEPRSNMCRSEMCGSLDREMETSQSSSAPPPIPKSPESRPRELKSHTRDSPSPGSEPVDLKVVPSLATDSPLGSPLPRFVRSPSPCSSAAPSAAPSCHADADIDSDVEFNVDLDEDDLDYEPESPPRGTGTSDRPQLGTVSDQAAGRAKALPVAGDGGHSPESPAVVARECSPEDHAVGARECSREDPAVCAKCRSPGTLAGDDSMEDGEIRDGSPVKRPFQRRSAVDSERRLEVTPAPGRRRDWSDSESDRSPPKRRRRLPAFPNRSPLAGHRRRRRESDSGRRRNTWCRSARAEQAERRREDSAAYRSPPSDSADRPPTPATRGITSGRRTSRPDQRTEEQEGPQNELFPAADRSTGSPVRKNGGQIRKLSRYLDAFINNRPYCEDSVSRFGPPDDSLAGGPLAPRTASPAGRHAAVAKPATPAASGVMSPASGTGGLSSHRRRRRRGPVLLGDSDGVVLTVAAAEEAGREATPPADGGRRRRSESPDTLERLARAAEGCGPPSLLTGEDSEMSLLAFCR